MFMNNSLNEWMNDKGLLSTTTYSTASSTRPDDLTFSSGRTQRRRTQTGTASGRTAPYVALFLEVRIEVSPLRGPKLSSERHEDIAPYLLKSEPRPPRSGSSTRLWSKSDQAFSPFSRALVYFFLFLKECFFYSFLLSFLLWSRRGSVDSQ